MLVNKDQLPAKLSKFIGLMDLFYQFIYLAKYYVMNPIRFMLLIRK
jgi:hypothetical protein